MAASAQLATVPAALGYRMPAEWEPHAATWLSWPHNRATRPGRLEPSPGIWARLVAVLAAVERVHVLAGGEGVMAEASALLGRLPNVTLHDIPTNDAWTRDHGPIFLAGRGLPAALVHFGYNAWGGKYPPYDLDQQIPWRMAEALGVPCFDGGMVLEGGSIDVNGEGLLLTTEACLLNPNRNPHLTRDQIEQRLCDYLGVSHVLWLGDGIVGDDTDGHIDDLTRFVAPDTVVTVVESNPADENYDALQKNLRRLRSMTDLRGGALRVVELPMPPAVVYEGRRLPASYANFYIANRVVLLPTFNHPNDDRAAAILAELFPTREIVGIDCTDMVWGLGAWHCLTQQVPAV
ncbi:MAG: agmatine deiminase family protein [Roseiflexus sp.]|nr:agmatine deiminase family protein [Roseiflexus sp.]